MEKDKTMIRITTVFIWLAVLMPYISFGQMVIGANTEMVASPGSILATSISIDNRSLKTDWKDIDLLLLSTGTTALGIKNGVAQPLAVNDLTINSKATYAIAGEWLVLNDLIFTEGKLNVDKAFSGKLGYKGSNDLIGSDVSYINGRIFIFGSGLPLRTFPIGNAKGYFPAQLTAIDVADKDTPIGMEVISVDPGFATSTSIKEIFTDHFWELTIGSGTFSGKSPISLSEAGTSSFFTTIGDIVVLEKDAAKQNELGGIGNNTFITSSLGISTTGKTYALAKSDVITVKVHKLITPDDDNVNDVLVIDGIDAFADNEVTLLDRWGVPFKTWKGFVNYPPNSGSSQDVDFSKLGIGNYICIVRYTEKGVSKSIKQMISVLK